MRFRRSCKILLGLSLLAPGTAGAQTRTSVLEAYAWSWAGALDQAYAQHAYDGGPAPYSDQSMRHELQTSLHYGLAPGTEVFLNTQAFSLTQATFNSGGPDQTPAFFNVVGGGARLQWLEDSGATPACIFETELDVPTGPARFRDFAAYVNRNASPVTSADRQGLQLSLGGVTSTYLDPVELKLGVHYLTPGHDEFISGGYRNSVDFGQMLKTDGEISVATAKNLAWSLQGQCLATAATVWRRNGQNILDTPDSSPEVLSLEAHALGGAYLRPAFEAYVGPAVLFSQPTWEISLACQAGLTPDSDLLRLHLSFTKLFKQTVVHPSKKRRISKRSPRDVQALSRRQQNLEISNLLEQADEALSREDLGEAVIAWNEVLRRNPKNARALKGLRDNQEDIQEAVKELYLEGMQDYVQNDYASAIETWQDGLRYNPTDAKLLSSIAQTQKKLENLRQIKRPASAPPPAR
jgi:hypothetical protein